MQHAHSPLPPQGGASANIPDRVFDRGARLGLVIARIDAPFDAAFEIPQPRDVALASGAVTGQLDSAQQSPVRARTTKVRTSYLTKLAIDDQPVEGPAPGTFGRLKGLASVPPIQLVNLALPAKLPNVARAAPIGAFVAVIWSNCDSAPFRDRVDAVAIGFDLRLLQGRSVVQLAFCALRHLEVEGASAIDIDAVGGLRGLDPAELFGVLQALVGGLLLSRRNRARRVRVGDVRIVSRDRGAIACGLRSRDALNKARPRRKRRRR